MKKLMILQGLPASGKTTVAREWVNQDPKNRVRVNRDDIRDQLGPYWIPSREKLVTSIEDVMIRTALQSGYNVIVDATNFRGTERFQKIVDEFLIDEHVDISLNLVDTPLEECIRRDAERPFFKRVGKEVIMRMYNKNLKNGKN